MPSRRFSLLAVLAVLIAHACKESEPEGGPGNSTSQAGASDGGEQASGAGGAAEVAQAGSSSASDEGGAGGRAAGASGGDGNAGEPGATGPVTFGTCSPNPCLVLASGQPYPRHLVVDSDYVYWTNEGTTPKNHTDAAVMKVSLDGGKASVAAADGFEPLAIVKDADNLYWTTGNGAPTLRKMPIAGGESELLAPDIGSWTITLDGDQIYGSSYTGLGLLSVPVDGGTPDVLYPTAVSSVVFDSENLYFATADRDGSLTGVAGARVLVSMPKGGGELTALTSALDLPLAGVNSLVLASDSLYWGDATRETVETVKLDGTGRRIIASEQHSVFGIGADADYVYWTSDRQGGVLKAPLDGSAEPVQIAKFPSKAPWGLTLDADHIYVTVYDYMGMIVKIDK
jgi:hypothetical protein